QVKLDAEARTGIAGWDDAGFVGHVLHLVAHTLPEHIRKEDERPCDDHRKQTFQQDREIQLFIGTRHVFSGSWGSTLTIMVAELECQPTHADPDPSQRRATYSSRGPDDPRFARAVEDRSRARGH